MATPNEKDEPSTIQVDKKAHIPFCNRIMWVVITICIIALGYYTFTPESRKNNHAPLKQGATTEESYTQVLLGQWTVIETNPNTEWIDVNPVDPKAVSWQAVVNRDFKHPLLSTPDRPIQTFGQGVTSLHIALIGKDGPREHPFMVKRVPK